MAGNGIKDVDTDSAQVKIVLRKSGGRKSKCKTHIVNVTISNNHP